MAICPGAPDPGGSTCPGSLHGLVICSTKVQHEVKQVQCWYIMMRYRGTTVIILSYLTFFDFILILQIYVDPPRTHFTQTTQKTHDLNNKLTK